MLTLEMRTSPRLVQQIAAIERFGGAWDRLSLSEAVASGRLMQEALRQGALAMGRLDATTPVTLSSAVEVALADGRATALRGSRSEGSRSEGSRSEASPPIVTAVDRIISAHLAPAEFDEEGLGELYSLITGIPIAHTDDGSLPLRRTMVNFLAPSLGGGGDEIIFPTVSSFLVEQRLAELLEWTRHELEEGAFHPLFIAGVFHLVFLQIHPFPTANHSLALVLLWRLLDAHGYGFVRYSHFAEEFSQRSKQYFAALRQAEKSALGTWSTLNVWLEFFLETMVRTSEHLIERAERTVNVSQLTSVQRKIIDVVRANGSVTRERIVTETGINLSTVKYNLAVLASRGHLKRDGGGRTTSYRAL